MFRVHGTLAHFWHLGTFLCICVFTVKCQTPCWRQCMASCDVLSCWQFEKCCHQGAMHLYLYAPVSLMHVCYWRKVPDSLLVPLLELCKGAWHLAAALELCKGAWHLAAALPSSCVVPLVKGAWHLARKLIRRCGRPVTSMAHSCQRQERGLALMGGREGRVRIGEPRRELRGLQHWGKQIPTGNSHPVSEPEGLHSEVHDAR